ncbi:MAG: LysR substrate-binding domain-containing protein [Mediterraneibacter gnavus]|uniref:LysR substrate-binding domain-containing protein n=1 Tax=Mediterraneibacter gnavus TaxID=33038 RepID=UPI002AC338DC|nr:LysR substrate-binding domain-containing protein [Mediterraneibacter gnavus]
MTRFGEEFLSCAEHTLSTLDEGITTLHRNARGEGLIRIGMLRPLGIEYIPRLAAGFLKANPRQDIQFTFHTGVTQYLLDGLAARKYDLVFCSQPSEEHKFTAVPIQKQNLIMITPQSHPLSAKDSVDLVETIPYPQIFFEKSAGIRNVIDQMFARTGASPKIAYETEEDQVIAGLVAQGFGIAVAPYMDILQKLNVNILQIRSPNYERAFFMVHNDCVFIPPVVQKFRQFVLDDGMMLTEEPA